MLTVIADHIKQHRHELGQHALYVGSGVVIPPADLRVEVDTPPTVLDPPDAPSRG